MRMGEILSELREDKGLTQLELSKQLHISNSSISAYETGARMPNPETLKTFAAYYDVTVDYLLGLIDAPLSPDILMNEFANGVKYSALLQMLDALAPQQRTAILLIIENMKFYVDVANKTAASGKKP
ncbi:MAG: helix-turn-helix transcriptional regulator [Oscillospiraceae bacterium]|nr:helix-turn-helix transcriptional regulator [Oscillospiraceae bacterium]